MKIIIFYILLCFSSREEENKHHYMLDISLRERFIYRLINEIQTLQHSLADKPENIKQCIARQIDTKLMEKAILEDQVKNMKDSLKRY